MLLLLGMAANAQNKTVTGKVTDSTGAGLSGISVTVKGKGIGTQTGTDGSYTLLVPAGSTRLVFSSVGYTSKEVSVNAASSIVLVQTNSSLNDVVVIGYGTVRKRDQTGSISTVSAKDFNTGVNTTPEQLIVGKVAGVSITPNGGQPGQGSIIRIRQGASLNASNDPLIVVDGVPLTGGLSGSSGTAQNSGISNPLSLINPADIETFTILKDAASTAIYGSRASNGVILITTKKGRSGAPVFNVGTQLSGSVASAKVSVLSAAQITQLVNTYGSAGQVAELGGATTDWQNQIYQTAMGTNNNLSVAGAIKKINLPYRLSFNYSDQTGILKTDNLERYTAGIRLNPHLFTDHLKIDINVNAAIVNTRFANQGAIGSSTAIDPTQPVYQKNQLFGGYNEYTNTSTTGGNSYLIPSSQATRNPLALLEQKSDMGKAQKLYGNIQFDYKFHFLPELHANLNLGYEGQKGSGGVYVGTNAAQSWSPGTFSGTTNAGSGSKTQYLQNIANSTAEFYLNYNKDIKSLNSNVNATAGYGYYDYLTTNYNYAARYANDSTVPGTTPTFPFDKPRFTLLSYYSRLIYTYNNKYIFAGSLRTDGSSRFAPANRWGVFPSAAVTWKIGQEQFLKNSKTVSNLNLRLSYGVTGNQDGIGLYSYIPNYTYSTNQSLYQIGSTFYHVYAPVGYNSDIKWEQTATYNAGLDYGFFKNRINGSLDVYDKKTTNLLNTVNVTPGTNFANQITANVGSMDTKGVEFLINVIPVQTKDVTWNLGFNVAYNKRNITALTAQKDPSYVGILSGGISGGTGTTIQITAVNHEPNAFYVYKQIYDPKTNKPIEGLYEDLNRDGQVNASDLYISNKTPYPVFILGFNTSVSVDKWSVSTSLHGNIGNYVYNNMASNSGNVAALFNNTANTIQNVSTAIYSTMFKTKQLFSDYYLENASFLRMDNLTFAYDAGKVFNNKVGLRVSGTAQNIFTITKYTGLNPEVYSGIDNNLYPIPRMFVLSANLTF